MAASLFRCCQSVRMLNKSTDKEEKIGEVLGHGLEPTYTVQYTA